MTWWGVRGATYNICNNKILFWGMFTLLNIVMLMISALYCVCIFDFFERFVLDGQTCCWISRKSLNKPLCNIIENRGMLCTNWCQLTAQQCNKLRSSQIFGEMVQFISLIDKALYLLTFLRWHDERDARPTCHIVEQSSCKTKYVPNIRLLHHDSHACKGNALCI